MAGPIRSVGQRINGALGVSVACVLLLGALPGVSAAQSRTTSRSASYSQVILADHPIMYWRLGELNGSAAFDSSGNGRDATYINGPHLGKPGAIVNDLNTSVAFGVNDYVQWNPGTDAYSGAFTVEAWLFPGTHYLAGTAHTFFNTRYPGEESFDFKLTTAGYVGFKHRALYVDVGNGAQWFVTGAHAGFRFRPHRWYYVAAVVTTTGVTLFANGTALKTFPFSGAPLLFDSSHDVQIATYNAVAEWFMGRLDEVAVYDYALTAEQVAAHYAAGINP